MTLMECVLALAMLAFALPGVLLVFAEVHDGSRDVSMEGEARRVIPRYVRELLQEGFPEEVDQVVWLHGSQGRCLGRLDQFDCSAGVPRHEGVAVSYLVTAEVRRDPIEEQKSLLLCLEHPAAAAAPSRKRIRLFTRIIP